jgi:uncharacterized phage protein (TIGR01671 family)
MDKIFKAKRIDNGEWVEFDSIIHCNEKCYFFKYGSGDFDSIPLSKGMEIDKNTICQYTGIDDSEGNRIFEGDEVSLYDEEFIVKFSEGEFVGDNSNFKYGILSVAELSRTLLTGHNIHDKV